MTDDPKFTPGGKKQPSSSSTEPNIVPLGNGYQPKTPPPDLNDVRDLQWTVVNLNDEIRLLSTNVRTLVRILKQQSEKLDELLEQRK